MHRCNRSAKVRRNSGWAVWPGTRQPRGGAMIPEIAGYLDLLWHAAGEALVLAALWWLALCAVVAWLAREKGHTGLGFFLIALVFSPLAGLLAVIAARDLKALADARAANDVVREMISPLALHIDGIRGHLA